MLPARLNSAIAWFFVVGASCFALGTIPALHAVGANADAMTFFVGFRRPHRLRPYPP